MIKKQLYRMRWKGFQLKKRIMDILCDEKGIGVVEVILILVVLIGLVIIFKSQLTSLVNTIFEKITISRI